MDEHWTRRMYPEGANGDRRFLEPTDTLSNDHCSPNLLRSSEALPEHASSEVDLRCIC
jgi:hypothetical protein